MKNFRRRFNHRTVPSVERDLHYISRLKSSVQGLPPNMSDSHNFIHLKLQMIKLLERRRDVIENKHNGYLKQKIAGVSNLSI